MRKTALVCALALASMPPASAAGQENADGAVLDLGAIAPDFEVTGATRFGVLRDPVRLSDYHGKAVVLAFFYRARTPG